MANMKPFQVIVTFNDGTRKEYGFNTAMERTIYLWGVRDTSGKVLVSKDEINYKDPCMACGSKPAERTYLRKKSGKSSYLVVDLCEPCTTNIIMLNSPFLAEGGGRLVDENETFGLPWFEDLVR